MGARTRVRGKSPGRPSRTGRTGGPDGYVQFMTAFRRQTLRSTQLAHEQTELLEQFCRDFGMLGRNVVQLVDIVDTALSPLGNGTSQPATEPLVATLQGTPYDTGIEIKKLLPIVNHFKKVADRLKADGFLSPKVLSIDINALIYQVPGGMLSNLISQLKQQNKSDKLEEVLAEVPNVRKDCGYPPLVTPSSQIVGTQAVLNVLAGERYKMVTKEFKGILRGEYGKLPAEPDAGVVKKCIGNEKRITYRPADDLKPEYDQFKAEIAEYLEQEEDVLSYAVFGQVALNFFKWRKAQQSGVDKNLLDAGKGVYPV